MTNLDSVKDEIACYRDNRQRHDFAEDAEKACKEAEQLISLVLGIRALLTEAIESKEAEQYRGPDAVRLTMIGDGIPPLLALALEKARQLEGMLDGLAAVMPDLQSILDCLIAEPEKPAAKPQNGASPTEGPTR
jgi:hypothetical protein